MGQRAMQLFIGIDPGQSSGAIGFVDEHGNGIAVENMPPTNQDLLTCLAGVNLPVKEGEEVDVVMVWAEKVHAMPGQGVSSTFKFGENYGKLTMAVEALGYRLELVQPRLWQSLLMIPTKGKDESQTQFKNRLKAVAQRLFPGVKITKRNSDALLIAEACRRQHSGQS